MSKQRRPPGREVEEGRSATSEAPRSDHGGHEQGLGHEATRDAPSLAGAALATSPVADLAGRVALALRFAPREAATVERLIAMVERSELGADRREAIVERLRGDLELAIRVSEAVRDALGRDDPAERSALVGALERAADAEGGARAPEQVVAEVVAASTGHDPAAVADLCRALSGWILWWEEDEEEAPPGDYAAEESGS